MTIVINVEKNLRSFDELRKSISTYGFSSRHIVFNYSLEVKVFFMFIFAKREKKFYTLLFQVFTYSGESTSVGLEADFSRLSM